MGKKSLSGKKHIEIVNGVREYLQEHPDATTREVADTIGVTMKTARNTMKEVKIQVADDNQCFAYDTKRKICKVLTKKDKACGSRQCAFFKTAGEYEEGRQKAIKRCKETGYLYGKNYKPKEW